MANKYSPRQSVITLRDSLSEDEVEFLSGKVFRQFQSQQNVICPHWQNIQSVGMYAPIRGEVDTQSFFDFVQQHKKLALFPKMQADLSLQFLPVQSWSELSPDPLYGILEPTLEAHAQATVPDLIFIPGVVFSQNCDRMGYGKGFYDRTIGAWRAIKRMPVLVGLAYDFQVVPSVPGAADQHNQPLHFVITESKIFRR